MSFARDTLKANYLFWTRDPKYYSRVLQKLKTLDSSDPAGGLDSNCPKAYSSCINWSAQKYSWNTLRGGTILIPFVFDSWLLGANCLKTSSLKSASNTSLLAAGCFIDSWFCLPPFSLSCFFRVIFWLQERSLLSNSKGWKNVSVVMLNLKLWRGILLRVTICHIDSQIWPI